MRFPAGLLVGLLVATPYACGANRISVLYLGDPYGSSPYFALEGEPGLRLTPVPTFTIATSYPEEYGDRMIRAYLPRRREELAAFDVIVLSDVRVSLLPMERIGWVAGALTEEGVGVAMIGGLDSYSGVDGASWHASPLGPFLPVSGGTPVWATARLSWLDADDPLIRSLPFGEIGAHGTFAGYNEVEAKPGSRVAAVIESDRGAVPLIAHWEVGRGRFLAFASEWKGDTFAAFCRTPEECHLRGTRWGDQFAAWEYSADFARNLVYLLCGRDYPPDPQATHIFRSRLEEYELMVSLAHLQLEFLDEVSAPEGEIGRAIADSRSHAEYARELYVSGRVAESIEALDEGLAILAQTGSIATAVRQESLLWHNAIVVLLVAAAFLSSASITATIIHRGLPRSSHPHPKRPRD